MAHVAIAIKNRILNSLNDRADICRMSERPNHVIIQDVSQGTCISFLRLQQQLSSQNQTLDPTARSPLKTQGYKSVTDT